MIFYMDFAERDEIVDQVLIRMNELSDEDKKSRAIRNRKVLSGASKEQSKRMVELFRKPYAGGRNYIDCPHAWRAIYEINKLVPWIIGVRYSNPVNEGAYYNAYPPEKTGEVRTHLISVPNQMLTGDRKLAEQISRELTDILFKYMEPDSWDEKEQR